jgi:hypothetical protein
MLRRYVAKADALRRSSRPGVAGAEVLVLPVITDSRARQ